jgi:hypothetical protein
MVVGKPFIASCSPYYKPMLDVIATCVSTFKGPNFHDLRGPLLLKDVKNINDDLRGFQESCKKIGCVIVFDGWNDDR